MSAYTNGWRQGGILVPVDGKMVCCNFWAKVYDEPSEFGIEGGRISKLEIRIDGKCTCNYDRGWDIKPMNEATEIALAILRYDYDHVGDEGTAEDKEVRDEKIC